jgi:hypothetical protein
MKYQIGDETFATQKALIERCRSLLYLGIETPEDTLFLTNLLLRHPRAATLIGGGIGYFFTKTNSSGRLSEGVGYSRVFCVRRPDNTEEQFSYLECIKGE